MSGFLIDQSVRVNDSGIEGTVRFVGETAFAPGIWVGVELISADGKNDGSIQGHRYFDCEMGRGMFLRPPGLTIIAQPLPMRSTNGTAARKPARPSSFSGVQGRRLSTVPDPVIGKRMSVNASSPSPAARPGSRSSGTLRSPVKSPTKALSAANSSAATSRTGTPSHVRLSSNTTAKPRPNLGVSRNSMPPPPKPAAGAPRGSSVGSTSSRASVNLKNSSGRASTALKPKTRVSQRIASISSQYESGHETEDEAINTLKSDTLSSKSVSPVLPRMTIATRPSEASSSTSRSTVSPMAQRPIGTSSAAAREIEDLKTKIRVMEKKAIENRDKMKNLEKIQEEKERFEAIIQRLQSKYQPQQQELTDLRKQLKEAQSKVEEVENIQVENDLILEMATLDREMAEETAEVLKTELDALKLKTEELELEVEVLREENEELGGEMSPEEKTSQGWLQMERNNERLREALIRLRDMTQQTEAELRDEIKTLREDLHDFGSVKGNYEVTKEKLAQSEAVIEDLRQQLDNALGAEDMIEELTDKNMSMQEELEELKATIADFEILKEVSDEVEINHVEIEKEMQEDIDFKESVIFEQKRRAAQQDQTISDMEYTLSRFRELVTNLQGDLEDMKASHAMTETESEQLDSRSRAMLDLNMKLQVSAAKTQVKTIDLELRRLDAQEASEHLAIVQLFLPEAFSADRDSVLALLRFKRVGFKSNLLHGFVKERVTGPPPVGHENGIFAACDVLDKLSWVSAMCDRFVNAISHCTIEEFAKYEGALYELEPVERALNGWIDGLRKDELKENQCASELQRTVALMSHLAEIHIPNSLGSYADNIHMKTLIMQSHLENAAAAMNAARIMVEAKIPSQGDANEIAPHFSRRADTIISQTRSAKVIIGKAVRALEDLKTRSLSLTRNTIQQFEQCEEETEKLARFSRDIGYDLFLLLHEEGRLEPFTYAEVQNSVYRTTMNLFASSETDLFTSYSNKLRALTNSMMDLAALASDLEMTEEFERAPEPWILRSQELKSSKTVPIDAEEEIRRLKDDNHERARLIAMRDQTLEEASVKIELLESRMKDANRKTERITELELCIMEAKKREAELAESVESQNKELTNLEADREKWKKIAEDVKALGVLAPGSKAGQERAVATAREMETLKTEIVSLQAAVRYLREDNRRTHINPSNMNWLEAPLLKPVSHEEQRQNLVLSEGKDVLNELLNLTSNAKIYDLRAVPKNKLAWRPAKTTSRHHVAKQQEDYESWRGWKNAVVKKAHVLEERDTNRVLEGKGRGAGKIAAQVKLRMLEWQQKDMRHTEVKIVQPDDLQDFQKTLGFV